LISYQLHFANLIFLEFAFCYFDQRSNHNTHIRKFPPAGIYIGGILFPLFCS